MKSFNTANTKNPDFSEEFVIYVGTQTGSFKRVDLFNEKNPFAQSNLQKLDDLTKHSKISCLNWSDAEQSEILIGRGDKIVRTFDCKRNQFSNTDLEVPGEDGNTIVGVAWNDESIVAATDNGKINILSDSPTVIETGDHLSKMRNCFQNKKIVAVGGKERKNNLKIFDLETKECIFTSKNIPHDNLQLEVPVWDNDFRFLDNSEHNLVTCSRYGYIRFYDTRQQRRPVKNYTNDKDLAFSCLAESNGIVYAGTTTGTILAFDLKSLKYPLHTYKGFTGSITDVGISPSDKYVYACGLDRYVRVHDAKSTHLVYQCYIKSKATQILLKNADNEIMDELNRKQIQKHSQDLDQEYEELFDKMPTVGEKDEDKVKPKKRKSESQASGKRSCGLKIKE